MKNLQHCYCWNRAKRIAQTSEQSDKNKLAEISTVRWIVKQVCFPSDRQKLILHFEISKNVWNISSHEHSFDILGCLIGHSCMYLYLFIYFVVVTHRTRSTCACSSVARALRPRPIWFPRPSRSGWSAVSASKTPLVSITCGWRKASPDAVNAAIGLNSLKRRPSKNFIHYLLLFFFALIKYFAPFYF